MVSLEEKVERLELLHRVGVALTGERNRDRLMEMILLEAKRLCHAEGGTLYVRTKDDHLRFEIMHNERLGIALGGTTGSPVEIQPIPMFDRLTGAPNRSNVATCAANLQQSVIVEDAYDATGYDFSGTQAFDARTGYRSQSFLTIPLINTSERVIGVLQLINARRGEEVIPFGEEDLRIVEALASLAAVALENQMLLDEQKDLLESFIRMIAAAIDSKSPYTGGHCERVPVLTMMLARAAIADTEGPMAEFSMSDEEFYELRIAAWLHDCGKVTTPVHIMDKATKLETIWDRIQAVRTRFEVLERDLEIQALQALLRGEEDVADALREEKANRREDLAFLERVNLGAEFLSDEDKRRIEEIGAHRYHERGVPRALLSLEEIQNLQISRGTLTEDERLIINGHMVQTITMLESLPFPDSLKRVPEYAGGHHEKIDGKGYPRGIYAGDMSIPARMMAIADVFEALTAQDRPYKRGKTLSETMRIMGFMKRDNHLDPELLDFFVTSGVYRRYAERFLPPELIDEVDEQSILEIEPTEVVLPKKAIRDLRKEGFLPAYEPLVRSVMGDPRTSFVPADLLAED